MAKGDVYEDYNHNLADDGEITAQPAGTAEAVIHNISHGGDCEIYRSDGNDTLIETLEGVGNAARHYHVTNAYYIKIKNISGGAGGFGFDGMYTKA